MLILIIVIKMYFSGYLFYPFTYIFFNKSTLISCSKMYRTLVQGSAETQPAIIFRGRNIYK